jgi:hypothetical protein
VVVEEGETTLEPLVDTAPMPGLIEALLALVDDQLRVVD